MRWLLAKTVLIFYLNNFLNYLLSLTYDTGFHMDVKYFASDQFQMHNIDLSWYFNT